MLFILLSVIWAAAFLNGWKEDALKENELPIAEVSDRIPYPLLEDLAPEMDYTAFSLSDITNIAEFHSDLFAPQIILTRQAGSFSLNDKTISGGLSVAYYETIHPSLAERIAKELIHKLAGRSKNTVLHLADQEIDTQKAFQADFPTIVLQEGRRVFCIFYYATSDDFFTIDEISALYSDFLKDAALKDSQP